MRRVAFVDDDPMILRALRRVVERAREPWDAAYFGNAEEALRAFAANPVDVVVSDLQMPGLNGVELLTRVKNEHPGTLRVMLTGKAGDVPISTALAHQLWTKPWDMQGLLYSLGQLFRVRALLQDPMLRARAGDADSLPSVPTIVSELLTVLSSADSSADEVARVIAKDPAMVAKVLQLVNSAFVGPATRVSNIQRAVSYLGLGTIRNLVLAHAAFRAFERATEIPSFDIEALQASSLTTAKVAGQCFDDQQRRDDAFAGSLLKGVGLLVLADQLPGYLEEVLRRAKETHGPLHLVERAATGVTYAEIGGYLLGAWGLPSPIVEAVAFQFEPRPDGEREFEVADAVYVASRLIEEVSRGAEEGESRAPALDPEWLEELGVIERLGSWRDIAKRVVAAGAARAHPRRAVAWQAEWSTNGGPHGGVVRDIGPKGLFLQPIPEAQAQTGRPVRVRASVPGVSPVELPGIIRWTGRSPTHGCVGFGVEFDRVHDELKRYAAAP